MTTVRWCIGHLWQIFKIDIFIMFYTQYSFQSDQTIRLLVELHVFTRAVMISQLIDKKLINQQPF